MLLDGEFAFGFGSGEALNEHIFGDAWPNADVRREMLEESIEVIRELWQGGVQSHRGRRGAPPDPADAAHFEQAAQLVTTQMLAEEVVCGPDVDRHVAALKRYADAGFDELYVNQVGPNQDAFCEAYSRHVLPALR